MNIRKTLMITTLLTMLSACAESNNKPIMNLNEASVVTSPLYGKDTQQVGKMLGDKKTIVVMEFNHNGKAYQVATFKDALALFTFENGGLVYVSSGRDLYLDMYEDTGTDKNKVVLFEKGMGELLRELSVLDYRNIAKTHTVVSVSEDCIFNPPCKSQGLTSDNTALLIFTAPITVPVMAVLAPLWIPGTIIESIDDNAFTEKLRKVQLGMSYNEVVAITGIPQGVRVSNDKSYEVLTYKLKTGNQMDMFGLRNGRLEWRRIKE